MDNWDESVIEIDRGDPGLTVGQQERVLKMMEVLRSPVNLQQIAEIKENCMDSEHYEYARSLFEEFSQDEQRALWVAPTYGGIFTTHERAVLKNLVKESK